jgi:hypothetical protein
MLFILLMRRSSSFKISCGLELLRWSNIFCKFWKFMIHVRLTLCSSLCLIIVSSLLGLWITMWETWELYSSCFLIWSKCRNWFFNDNVRSCTLLSKHVEQQLMEESCVARDSPGFNSPHRAQVLQNFCALGRQV